MIVTNCCLGRLPARHDPRNLCFASYGQALPAPPVQCDWGVRIKKWPMMLNDNIGDCTIAAAAHLIQEWTANVYGVSQIISDADILKAYEAVSGYTPSDPNSDSGAVELDVLNFWRKTGIGGHKILAFAKVTPQNTVEVKQATYLFGGLYLGVSLPIGAQQEINAGQYWTVPPGGSTKGIWKPGSWGGHAVPVVAYDANYVTVVTWGALQKMSWRFFNTYVEEAWAVLGGADWMKGGTLRRYPFFGDRKEVLMRQDVVAIVCNFSITPGPGSSGSPGAQW
jgi:hypothetical protein